MASSSSLVFKVERKEPVLIAPAKPTPYEIKNLSDIDNQMVLRTHIDFLLIYSNVKGMEGKDPVETIKKAIAEVLVSYYPLAGRIREGANNKLMVECTGEGVLFVEADAHVRLDEFGDVLKPPFPCMQDIVYKVPGSDGILGSPLLLIQVTRLLCGGFMVTTRMNHTMMDAFGLVQFMNAIAEMARGINIPSIQPVWRRELIRARDPPTVSCLHPAYEELSDNKGISPPEAPALIQRSFVVGPKEIAFLKEHIPQHFRHCSRFEILTACLWRCHVISLNVNPSHQVRMAFSVNVRSIYNPPLPVGYYGNAFGMTIAQTTAGKLCQSSLGYALEMVRKAKSDVTDEFMRSLTDLLVKRDQPIPTIERPYSVSDVTHVGLRNIDFGWGKAAYGGPIASMLAGVSFFFPLETGKGEDEIAVLVNLPIYVMEKFGQEFDRVTQRPPSTNSTSPLSHL